VRTQFVLLGQPWTERRVRFCDVFECSFDCNSAIVLKQY